MEYQKAKTIRGKSFGELLADNLISGEGIGASIKKTLSEKSKARTMGIKEKFDPLNIAKILTGGSRLGPALLGKMMGRSQADLRYFAGDPKKKNINSLDTSDISGETLQSSTKSLGRIYELLKQDRNNKVRQKERENSFESRIEKEEELRNRELVKALTARRKKKEKTPKEQNQEKKSEAKQKTTEKKNETENKKTETKKEVGKKQTAEKAKKEEVKQPAEKQKIETKEKKVEKPPKVEKVPEVKPPTAVPTAKAPAIKPSITGKLAGSAGLVVSALAAAGLSSKAQANILSQVKSESNFVSKSENLNYSSAKAIQNTFGKNRIPTEEFAQQFVKNPEALANHVYAKTDGNSEPGDGWKYRGRGFIQITGKNAYKALGEHLKMDLVSNPDLLNSPEVAAKSIPWFFLKYKAYLTKGDPKNLENISIVNKAVGFSDPTGEKASKRAALAMEYEKQDLSVASDVTTGTQIDRASTENKILKEQAPKDKPAIIVNNSTTTTQSQTPASTSAPVDDRPAYMKKIREQ